MTFLLALDHGLCQDVQLGLGSRSPLLLNVFDVPFNVPVIGEKLERHLGVDDGVSVDAG